MLDSGGQYLKGTTDITRTFFLGRVAKEKKIHNTLVLKGMLALSRAKFLAGVTGTNLDILANNFYGMRVWIINMEQGMV
nr:M24 family metallopeptidase [Fusobacterium gastrosuis]